jgi:hypothetical protein
LTELADAPLGARSDAESCELVADLVAVKAVMESTYMAAVRDLDSRT